MPPCVLIVDDCPDARGVLAILVRFWGWTSHQAPDGPAALALAAEHRPDVVLLDIGLPGMDGCEVARRLRALPGLEGCLLVALTGFSGPEDVDRALRAGCDHYLVKPYPEELHALLGHGRGLSPGGGRPPPAAAAGAAPRARPA
jgi:CheY-like chemotaxis protein